MKDGALKTFNSDLAKSLNWQVNGIKIGHSLVVFEDYSGFAASNHREDTVRLHLGLKGDYTFNFLSMNHRFDLLGGHQNLVYARNFDMEVQNKTKEIESFGISFPKNVFLEYAADGPEVLKKFCDVVEKGQPGVLTKKWGPIKPVTQNAIYDILNMPYHIGFQEHFLLSKSLELLVLCVEACEPNEERHSGFLKVKSDKEKVLAARDFINARITAPPNLSEVSQAIGLNEFKLKMGFKEMFGCTVFGYLTEQRLHLACRYILDTPNTIADISRDLGYATPQHFNNVFKKRFGLTPLDLKKNPKNAIPSLKELVSLHQSH